jgi:hypothetical protein
MTRDDIIRWAHEASPDMTWYAAIDEPDQASPEELGFLQRFAALVAAAERAACIDDSNAEARDDGTAQRIVERIRARGKA